MSCARYRGLLSRYVDGEVTPRQRSELLAHVDSCPECAAWLARARQADVLLKGGVPAMRPSDRVRATVLGAVKGFAPDGHSGPQYGRLRLALSQLLMRFDPGPRHYLAAFVLLVAVFAGGAYWLGLLPIGGYSQFGFLVQGEGDEARVNATPLAAVSRGEFGVGGLVAVPNTVRISPDDGAQGVSINTTL